MPGRALRLAAGFALTGLLLIAGCGGDSGSSSSNTSLLGTVQGGRTGVAGATVTLYEAGTAYGADATSLGTATTGSNGNFTISYTPPKTAALLYIVALGGDAGDGANSAIGLMGIAGQSNALPESMVINELTTVAAEWALGQFTDATGSMIGAPSTNATGFANAANQAQANLADIATGGPAAFWNTNGVDEASCAGGSPPVNCDGLERMDTLANILASCVESSGPSLPDCAKLLAFTLGSTTTLQAAHFLAIKPTPPTTHPNDLFPLQAESPPFTPALAAAPSDGWEIALNFTPSNSGLSGPLGIAIDASGNAWVTNYIGSSVTEMSSSGVLAGNYNNTNTTGANFDGPNGIAIDASGNAWIANEGGNSVTELSSSGAFAGNYNNGNTSGANFDIPAQLAIDASGNVWAPNTSGNSVTELSSSGTLGGYYNNSNPSGSGFIGPNGIAIDASGNAWVANYDGNSVTELSSDGSTASNYNPDGANFNGPNGIAIEASGNAWVTNAVGNSVTKLSSDGTLLAYIDNSSPGPTGFSAPYAVAIDSVGSVWITNSDGNSVTERVVQFGYFIPAALGSHNDVDNSPYGVAIDASGNVWTANYGGNSVSEIIGLAGAVLTPQVACLKQARPHAVCLP
jgi:streptogramin lyase